MPSFEYEGSYAYHVILTTQDRMPIFADLAFGERCVSHLKGVSEKTLFRLLAYSFMPDHVHMLVFGSGDSSNLLTFVQRIKQVTSYEFKQATGHRLWQQSFYDRTLRVEEELGEVARYILGNPVRAGLAGSDAEYPLSGGEYFEADEAKAPSLLPIYQGEANA